MTLKKLQQEKVCFVGLGTENAALINFLIKNGFKQSLTILDTKDKKQLTALYPELANKKNIVFAKDTRSLRAFKKFTIIFKSPGAHFSAAFRKQLKNNGVSVSSAMDLFFDLSPTKNIIGVTGSKGKGSTASLIHHILKKSGKRVFLGGNIGVAPFSFIQRLKPSDWVILELSSFQLQDMRHSPKISVITNLTREHLKPADPANPNYHPTIGHYWQSKLNIIRFQKRGDIAIVNSGLRLKIKKQKAKILFFKKSNLASQLPGEHNKENIAAAELAAQAAGVKQSIANKAIASFKGLEHRLQKIIVKKNIAYYNDSFATTPESAMTALASFNQPIILLAGGADKGSDFKTLAKTISKKTKYLILFKGKGSDRLLQALRKTDFPKQKTVVVDSMSKAMKRARQQAIAGDIILLSPACASFGVFKNYKDRGKQFIDCALK